MWKKKPLQKRVMSDEGELVAMQVAEEYGIASQLSVLQEECGELIAAISHWRRGRIDAEHEVILELLDVYYMVIQAFYLCQDDWDFPDDILLQMDKDKISHMRSLIETKRTQK